MSHDQAGSPDDAVPPVATRTKIVATVGPATAGDEAILALARAGVDVFRLNLAHGNRVDHEAAVASIRAAQSALGRPLAILADLAGPKIRLGELPDEGIALAAGQTIRIVRGPQRLEGELATNYPPLVDELAPGDRVLLADGAVALNVESRQPEAVVCRVVEPGRVGSRQGVNLPGAKLSLEALTEADLSNTAWAARHELDFVSLSFVRRASDVRRLSRLLAEAGSTALVIAKIEKPEALAELEAIVEAADGVMIARGDLGVEIDVARVPIVQKQIIRLCHKLQKPVITATQMLDSMQRSARPTRAEASDVANAILDGTDACMLSGETAVGLYPVAAVAMMNRIARQTEPLLGERTAPPGGSERPRGVQPITQAAVEAASLAAARVEARMIVVASHSGATALALSKQRNWAATVGASNVPAVLRQMCLYWGVIPLPGAPTDPPERLLEFVSRWGRESGQLEPTDRVVLVAGAGLGSKPHNQILVHELP